MSWCNKKKQHCSQLTWHSSRAWHSIMIPQLLYRCVNTTGPIDCFILTLVHLFHGHCLEQPGKAGTRISNHSRFYCSRRWLRWWFQSEPSDCTSCPPPAPVKSSSLTYQRSVFLQVPVPFVLPSQQCMTAEDTPPYTCHDYWVLIRFACFLMHWLMSCLCPDIQTESLTVYKTVADDNLASSLQTFTSQWVRALAVSD